MKFQYGWDFPALATFYDLEPRHAAAVDRAIIRFVETGEGDLTWVPPYHRLRAGPFDLALSLDRAARVGLRPTPWSSSRPARSSSGRAPAVTGSTWSRPARSSACA